MSFLEDRRYSQEAIDYQFDNSFFHKLAKAIGKARELNSRELTSLAPEVKAIGELITDFLGIKVECKIHPAKYQNAWVKMPDFNRNHPFYEMWQNVATSKDGLQALKGKDYDIGNVNRKTGKITGVYAKIACPITFTKGLMEAKMFTNEEIAAIALHEIGHIYSLFETMYRTSATNLAIASAIEDCVGVKDTNVRVKVIKGLIEQGHIGTETNPEALAQLDDDSLPVAVITAGFRKIGHDENAVCYNRTAWEQSADQFAVRMGAGIHLASGLNKLLPTLSEAKHIFIKNTLVLLAVRILTTFSASLLLINGPALMILYLLFVDLVFITGPGILEATHNTYDRYKDRIGRIRREQIGKLKMLDKDDPLVEDVLAQIDEMKKIEDENSNLYSNAFVYLYAFIYNLFTGQLDKKAQQQAVEKLLNNELYVHAARLKQKGK